jgi:flavin-dependent dehydrogenase
MLTRREWLGAAFGAAARTKRVIVVGAGMAGLAAALDLVDRGLETLVIEASPRASSPRRAPAASPTPTR